MTSPSHIVRGPAVILLALAACAHGPRRDVLSAASERRCEDAFYLFAASRPSSVADEARRVVTTPVSWALTVAGFATDAVVRVGGGITVGAFACMPIAVLEGALHGDGTMTGDCFGGFVGFVVTSGELPSAGRGVRRATRTWRCPDLAPVAREAREVAACYASRAMPGDAERARAVLASLRETGRVWDCLPGREQREVLAALAALPAPAEPPAAEAPPEGAPAAP